MMLYRLDRVVLASVVQEDGRAILHREGQGSFGTRRAPKDRCCSRYRQREQRGQDRAQQARRGLQDQLQRTIRRVEKAQRWWYLGRQVARQDRQAREDQGS